MECPTDLLSSIDQHATSNNITCSYDFHHQWMMIDDDDDDDDDDCDDNDMPESLYSIDESHNVSYTDKLPIYDTTSVTVQWYDPPDISDDSEEFFAQVDEFFNDNKITDE
uniref:Anaphase-promoting complex subunit 13 n=1 Tax=Loa loa TaxID=7209 RepID=A0A1I7VHG4_LOALO